jgi:hypothetical protein
MRKILNFITSQKVFPFGEDLDGAFAPMRGLEPRNCQPHRIPYYKFLISSVFKKVVSTNNNPKKDINTYCR